MSHDPTLVNYQLSQVPEDRRAGVLLWREVLTEFDAAADKGAAEVDLRARYGAQLALSRGSLYRKLAAWRQGGLAGLVPDRVRRRVIEHETPLAPEFLRFWLGVCAQNQRKNAPAWRSLIDDHLRAGAVIPGYGTDWRGIWKAEHPDWPIPDACPYSRKGNCLPRGWSQRNLHRHALDAYQRAAVRQGTAAAREFLPMIPTTRVGLPFGRVYVIDDVEYDVQTTFVGNIKPQGVVELGALELLTGHYCTWGAKPIRERADGTREKLSEDLNRYLIAHICCVLGFSIEGCTILGEHGTARLPRGLQETLDRLSGGMIDFAAGGILNKPLAKGLFLGLRRGNFRFKAALESHHNLKKNEVAALPGQKGADPEHAPEDLASSTQHHRAVMKACVALAEARPDLINQVRTGFVPYFQLMDAVSLLYDRIADRVSHALEGWEELGFVKSEWKIPGDPVWKPASLIDELDPADAEAIRGIIRRNPEGCWRARRMSPIEAFCHCQSAYRDRLVRLPAFAVPEILGPTLAHRDEIQPNAAVTIPHRYLPNQQYQVAAVVKHPDGTVETLARGTPCMIWLSPFDARNAYVATADGVYLGIAPVMVPGTKVDMHAWHRNVAVLNAMEGAELKKLAPVAESKMRDLIAQKEANIKALTGKTVSDIISARAAAPRIEAEADDALAELYGQKG